MGWLAAPTRRPPPLPSTLSLLLGLLFLATVVLPRVAADPKPQDDYYGPYGEYCLTRIMALLALLAPSHTHCYPLRIQATSHPYICTCLTHMHVMFTLP